MKKVICSKISVDCIKNDPVDIRCGGADVLGYDFFVEQADAERLVGVVKKAIDELNLPLIGISIKDAGKLSLSPEQVWKEDRILKCIVDESDVIIAEVEHQKASEAYQKDK